MYTPVFSSTKERYFESISVSFSSQSFHNVCCEKVDDNIHEHFDTCEKVIGTYPDQQKAPDIAHLEFCHRNSMIICHCEVHKVNKRNEELEFFV